MIRQLLFALLLAVAHGLTSKDMKQMKYDFWRDNQNLVKKAEEVDSVLNSPASCVKGEAVVGDVSYPCSNVDFLSLVGRAEMKVIREDFEDTIFEMSDIWGYSSPSGKEITLACQTNSLVFIDSTDPFDPKVLGYMESHREESFWCDVKVYKDTAYIVQDGVVEFEDRGMQVFDLKRLEADEVLNATEPIKFEPDFTYAEHGPVHNVVIDVDSGFLYNVGLDGGNNCNQGLHMVDLSTPLEPTFVGCAAEDGYVHDAQCLVYSGPDTKYFGEEICFGYNEDTLTIYVVTDKSNPVIISKTTYETASYTHQGWLNADQDFLLLNDETDEVSGGLANTRTYIVDVSSLEAPEFTGNFDHPDSAIDHNLYFWGEILARGWGGSPPVENPPSKNYVYCTNYAAGLRVLDTTDIKSRNPTLIQAGFFDVSPELVSTEFFGTWSSYMHPSGVIAVTGIESGVFFLNFTNAFVEPSDVIVETGSPTTTPTVSDVTDTPTTAPSDTVVETGTPTTSPTEKAEEDGDDNAVLNGFLAFFWVLVALGVVLGVAWQLRKRKIGAQTLIQSRLSTRPGMPNRTVNPSFKQEVSV